jgi:hypothetical protein
MLMYLSTCMHHLVLLSLPTVAHPPAAHPAFVPVREALLYSTALLQALPVVLYLYAQRTAGKHSETLLSRALQLITLQLHCLNSSNTNSSSSSSNSSSSGMTAEAYYEYLRRPLPGTLSGASPGTTSEPTSLLTLLAACSALQHSSSALGPLFTDGLHWILREVTRRDAACAAVLRAAGALPREAGDSEDSASSSSSSTAAAQREALLARKKAAQAQAMAAMASRQAAFAQHMGVEDSDEEEEELQQQQQQQQQHGDEGDMDVVGSAAKVEVSAAIQCHIYRR